MKKGDIVVVAARDVSTSDLGKYAACVGMVVDLVAGGVNGGKKCINWISHGPNYRHLPQHEHCDYYAHDDEIIKKLGECINDV